MADVAVGGMAGVAPGVMADVAPGVMADVAPEGMADVAPEGMADVAPGVMADVAPGVMADVAPEGMADVAPGGMADVAPGEQLVEEEDCAWVELEEGIPALGIKFSDGVLLATMKQFSNFTQDWISRIEMTGPKDVMVYNVMEYQYRGERRSEVLMIQAGWNDDQRRPYPYEHGPSDDFLASHAAAIMYEMRRRRLEMRWYYRMNKREALNIAVLNLRRFFEGQMTVDNIDIGIIDRDGFHQLPQT